MEGCATTVLPWMYVLGCSFYLFGRFNGVRNLDFCEQRPGLLGMFVIRFFQSRIKCLFFLS